MGFLKSSQSIVDTDNYTYDGDNKILTVSNYIGTNGYVQITSTYNTQNYKLQLPVFATFDANGGVEKYEMQSCYLELGATACSIVVSAPTRNNYQFLGWADSASATTAAYQAGSPVTLNEPKALYAVWQETLDPDDPSDPEDPNQPEGDDVVPVPDTSVTGNTTPNTGTSTNTEAGNMATVIFCAAPAVLLMIGRLVYSKNKGHRKFDC